jgi:hypothetical protein
MNTIVNAVCACYSLLLIVYPRALRDSYGAEMVETLRQQLLDGFESAGVAGAFRAAARAFLELGTIAIPSRLKDQAVAVFPLAICTSFAMLYTLTLALHQPDIFDPLMRRLGLQCP